jgi:hypothetical protein
VSPLPVLGGLPEIAPVVEEECGVRSVIVCFTDRMDADLVTVLRANAPLPADVYVVPRMYELATAIPAGSRDDVWGIPIIPLRPGGPRWPGQVAKRVVPEARQQAERWLWVPWGFRGPPRGQHSLGGGTPQLATAFGPAPAACAGAAGRFAEGCLITRIRLAWSCGPSLVRILS